MAFLALLAFSHLYFDVFHARWGSGTWMDRGSIWTGFSLQVLGHSAVCVALGWVAASVCVSRKWIGPGVRSGPSRIVGPCLALSFIVLFVLWAGSECFQLRGEWRALPPHTLTRNKSRAYAVDPLVRFWFMAHASTARDVLSVVLSLVCGALLLARSRPRRNVIPVLVILLCCIGWRVLVWTGVLSSLHWRIIEVVPMRTVRASDSLAWGIGLVIAACLLWFRWSGGFGWSERACCPRCGYDTADTGANRCPECGHDTRLPHVTGCLGLWKIQTMGNRCAVVDTEVEAESTAHPKTAP